MSRDDRAQTEEGRRLFQERLALLYRSGSVISAAFLLGIVVVRGAVGSSPLNELRSPDRWFHVLATLWCAGTWLALRKRPRQIGALSTVDAVSILVLIATLNLNAGLFEIRTVAVFNLVLTTGVPLLLRAVIVPSTAARTLTLGLVASLGSIAVFLLSALHPAWPVRQQIPDAGWPLAFQAVSLGLWLGVMVATATLTSRVVYHLRSEVRAARRLGQYILADKLGEGGMGVVYRATHAMLRRETAIKLLLPDRIDSSALRRFEQEVMATARLRHPNTIAIFDYGRTLDGVFYYAMEYLEGLTVDELVTAEGPLPPGRVRWLLQQVCASLEEAHEAGLIHRDIKPANVMVVGRPAAYDLVKVVDFGLVKAITPEAVERVARPTATAEREARASSPSSSDHTREDELVGTPLYMAPESITDPEAVDARSDLYAVAAVGYFMLTGQHVFEGATLVEICAAHLHQSPLPPDRRLGRSVAPDLEALLLRGLAKTPAERPGSAAAFREALAACDLDPWGQEQARAWWEGKRRSDREPPRSSPLPSRTLAVAPKGRVEPDENRAR